MSLLSMYNNGYKYILSFIDIFSRFAQDIPLKGEDGNTIHDALKQILKSGCLYHLK